MQPDNRDRDAFAPGTRIEVWNDFDGRWTPGFEVAEVAGDGLRLRRHSDGTVLPGTFGFDTTRRA